MDFSLVYFISVALNTPLGYLRSPVLYLRLMKASVPAAARRTRPVGLNTVVNGATIKWFVRSVTDLHTHRPRSAHYTPITSAQPFNYVCKLVDLPATRLNIVR